MTGQHPPSPVWAVLPTANPALGRVLLAYRSASGLTQAQLGDLLGFSQPYLSRVERGERTITDAALLRGIAARLGIPARLLGVTDPDRDPPAALELAWPALRLATIARQAGRALDAARGLWPVVAHLEAEHAHGRADGEFLRLLAEARMVFGVTLGHLLPVERLDVAVGWTARALAITGHLDDVALRARVRRMHGNELRKSGRHAEAISQLAHAAASAAQDTAARGAALVLLARAAAEAGHARLFDQASSQADRLLEAAGEQPPLFAPYALGEVQLRGAVRLGRTEQTAALLEQQGFRQAPPSPQWQVLERITQAEAMLALRDLPAALTELAAAVPAAAAGHLPQQLARITHALAGYQTNPAARELAQAARTRLAALGPLTVTSLDLQALSTG